MPVVRPGPALLDLNAADLCSWANPQTCSAVIVPLILISCGLAEWSTYLGPRCRFGQFLQHYRFDGDPPPYPSGLVWFEALVNAVAGDFRRRNIDGAVVRPLCQSNGYIQAADQVAPLFNRMACSCLGEDPSCPRAKFNGHSAVDLQLLLLIPNVNSDAAKSGALASWRH